MRKETILNYEKEFLAWCKGESILLGAPASMHEKPLVWREVRDFNDWKPLDTVYVLNDSYSTYRKALAEGKIVEVATDYNDADGYIWKSMEDKEFHYFNINEIRIKPEEPKFKVGDWVVEIHSTTKAQVLELFGNQIRVKFCYPDAIITTDSSDFIPWVPKKGECCWFWNKETTITILELLEIVEDGNRKYFAAMPNIPHSLGGYYQYCEPYIGQLPSVIKDNK